MFDLTIGVSLMVCKVLQCKVVSIGKKDMVKYIGPGCSIRNDILGEMIISLYALQILQYFFISYV